MRAIAYEKEADKNKHFYFVNFEDMKSAHYKFADSHIHHSIEMVFCYSGKMNAKINNENIKIQSGDVLLINPLDWHYYEYVGNAACYILVIAQDFIDDILSDSPDKEFVNKISFTKNEYKDVLELIRKNYLKFDSLSYIGKKSFILSVFSKLEENGLLRNKVENTNKNICKKIICYIEEHYTEKLDIGNVAKQFGYSRNYFSYLFNRVIGENFNGFVNKFRANKVQQMKKETPDALIEDLIFACGFSSRETYYRCIRNN